MKRIIFILLFFILHLSFNIEYCEAQWVQMSNGMVIYENVKSLTILGNNIFAGTYYSGVHISSNNGQNWTQTALNKEVQSFAISGNNIFVGTHYEGVWLSTNNGQNWTQAGLNNKYVLSFAISGNNIFAGLYGPYGVWFTTNNGQNWTQTALNNQGVSCLAISGNNIFAGTGYGVYLSTNNGQNWTQTALNYVNVYSLAISGNNIFAGAPQYGVYLSTNNGQSWTQTALNNCAVHSLVISGNNIFAGGYGIYLSTNNGQTWVQKNQGFFSIPYVQSLLIANDYIFAGTSGYSVWRRSLSEIIGIKNISTEIPSEFELGQNYPNPFNSNTIIRFQVSGGFLPSPRDGNDKIVLRVFDLLGREIRTLVNDELNPGTYEVRFEAGDLPSGVYFYRMDAENFVYVRSMILIK